MMARTLPWLVKTESRKSSTPVSSATNPAAHASTDSKKDQILAQAKRQRMHSRSPSTSPVREPPAEELMLEGLEKDESYMMVEDEFLATAQTFTRHLHHAEYVRRKREAKLMNQSTIVSRPTDGRTQVPVETRKKLAADKAAAKRKSAIDSLRDDTGRPATESEIEKSEGDKDDDLWIGTDLQPLMSVPQRARSLLGLNAVKTSTKASRGYPTEGLGNTNQYSNLAARSNGNVGQDISSEDDDSLDTSSRSRVLPSLPHVQPQTSNPLHKASRLPQVPVTRDTEIVGHSSSRRNHMAKSGNSIARSCELPRSTSIGRPVPTPPPEPKSRLNKFFDELDQPTLTISSDEDIQRPLTLEKRPYEAKMKNKRSDRDELLKKKKQRLNEVPTFL